MHQHLSAPMMHQILHIMMVMRCYTVLEQNDTMLKQFWFFKAKSQPHLHCKSGRYHTNWYGMISHKSISNEEYDIHDF